jgi:hypothetical protein
MRIRTRTRESFIGRVEADKHDVLWLIDSQGVRYQLALVCQGGGRPPTAHAPPEARFVAERGDRVDVSLALLARFWAPTVWQILHPRPSSSNQSRLVTRLSLCPSDVRACPLSAPGPCAMPDASRRPE